MEAASYRTFTLSEAMESLNFGWNLWNWLARLVLLPEKLTILVS